MRQVIVYSTLACPYCNKVKSWLSTHNISYKGLDVSEDEEAATSLLKETGQSTVPVIKVIRQKNVRIIIGFDVDELEEVFLAE